MPEHGFDCSCESCRLINRMDARASALLSTSFFDPRHADALATARSYESELVMMIYACRCRTESIHTSMGVPSCSRCSCCGSGFAPQGVSVVGEPEPHNYVIRYNEVTGVPYRVCDRCFEREDGE
jgi:hypothetical protein